MTVADMLAATFDYRLPDPPKPAPAGVRCAITGIPIAEGYPVMEVATAATNEFLNTFRGETHGWVSEAAARCFRAHPKNGCTVSCNWLIVEGVTAVSPMVSRKSAMEQGRPCWSDIVREVWPEHAGKRVLVILTTDTKKRLWPQARVGILGERTDVYLYDSASSLAENRLLSWPRLIETLGAVEEALDAGLLPPFLSSGLMADPLARKDPKMTLCMERRLSPMRNRPEWAMARLIGRKREDA